MKPFLQAVAEYYYQQQDHPIDKMTFVFPSKRAGIFFNHYLQQQCDKPIFAPKVMTINDFVLQRCPDDRVLQPQELLFKLYDAFTQVEGNEQTTIDDFIYWGNLMLRDFDELDRYLVDAAMLYTNLEDYKELSDDLSHLTENQKQAIEDYWGVSGDELQQRHMRKDFMQFWTSLKKVYGAFKQQLEAENLAYEGMLYRKAAMKDLDDIAASDRYFVFVGLFAPSPAEMKILKRLKVMGKAEFCWDIASEVGADTEHLVHRIRAEQIAALGEVKGPWLTNEQEAAKPDIAVVACPGNNVQAKLVPTLIQELESQGETIGINQAVILPNGTLHMPVIAALAGKIPMLNITLGYALKTTNIAILMNRWHGFLLRRRSTDHGKDYYVQVDQVIDLLSSRLIQNHCPKVSEIINTIREGKSFYLKLSELRAMAQERELKLVEHLLYHDLNSMAMLDHSIEILTELGDALCATEEEETLFGEMKTADDAATTLTLEQEFVFHYLRLVNSLKSNIMSSGLNLDLNSLVILIDELVAGLTIPFEGEPLKGLQVMGLLESRALSFEHLIVLSTEDRSLPGNKSISTLIPYTLRRGFGLPVSDELEALNAYHFFRLLNKAKKVTMLYNKSGEKGGIISRYVQQLRLLYDYTIRERGVEFKVAAKNDTPIPAKKTPEVMQRLKEKRLSATHLHMYVACPLRFYYEYVCEAYEPSMPEVLMNDADFGNVLHDAMMCFYRELSQQEGNRPIMAAMIEKYGKQRGAIIVEQSYRKLYMGKRKTVTELDKIYMQMVQQQMNAILGYDMAHDNFVYLDGEKRLTGEIVLDNGESMKIKGYVDRMDIRDGVLRIIDYKTGMITMMKMVPLNKLYDPDNIGKHKAFGQLLFYCELAWQQKDLNATGDTQWPMEGHLYAVRNMLRMKNSSTPFEAQIQYGVTDDTQKNGLREAVEYAEMRDEFLSEMKRVLEDIMDEEKCFEQRPGTACDYCPFALSCGTLSV